MGKVAYHVEGGRIGAVLVDQEVLLQGGEPELARVLVGAHHAGAGLVGDRNCSLTKSRPSQLSLTMRDGYVSAAVAEMRQDVA